MLNHRPVFKKVHKAIDFNSNAGLKQYIDLNTDLRKEAKKCFEKDFFTLMNNAGLEKVIKNVRRHRDNKLVTIARRRNYLPNSVSKLDYIVQTFHNSLAIEMRKTQILINKPVYFVHQY